MKESYCGLCNTCELTSPDFLKMLIALREYVEKFPLSWWQHCVSEEEPFSLFEFIRGLEWFIEKPECSGCKQGGGLKKCPIRQCAIQRQIDQCCDCPDVETCETYNIIIQKYPGRRIYIDRDYVKMMF